MGRSGGVGSCSARLSLLEGCVFVEVERAKRVPRIAQNPPNAGDRSVCVCGAVWYIYSRSMSQVLPSATPPQHPAECGIITFEQQLLPHPIAPQFSMIMGWPWGELKSPCLPGTLLSLLRMCLVIPIQHCHCCTVIARGDIVMYGKQPTSQGYG